MSWNAEWYSYRGCLAVGEPFRVVVGGDMGAGKHVHVERRACPGRNLSSANGDVRNEQCDADA